MKGTNVSWNIKHVHVLEKLLKLLREITVPVHTVTFYGSFIVIVVDAFVAQLSRKW